MRKKFFQLSIVSLFLIIADYFAVLTILKNPLEPLIVISKRLLYSRVVKMKVIPELISHYPELTKRFLESDRLTMENEEYLLEIKNLKEENEQLRLQLNASLPSSYRLIPAGVISKSRFLEIAAGEKDGVKEGMVVVEGKNLLGKIALVSRSRSTIMLLTDQELKVPAVSDRGTLGEVIGQFGQTVVFDKVLQKDPLFLDDSVLTSGTGGYPPDLIIGKVVNIITDDVAVYKQAKIEPLTDIKLKNTVFVINLE